MGAMLVSLHITNHTEIKTTGDGRTSTEVLAQNGIVADIMLSPDSKPDLAGLGFVRLRVEATPPQDSGGDPGLAVRCPEADALVLFPASKTDFSGRLEPRRVRTALAVRHREHAPQRHRFSLS
jgi:hypothetical protein